nr:hypothetical protein [Microvirga sp.]
MILSIGMEMDREPGSFANQRANRAGNEDAPEARRCPEAKEAFVAPGDPSRSVNRRLQLLEGAVDFLEDAPGLSGRNKPATSAVEELDSQQILNAPNCLCHGGLGNLELAGCPNKGLRPHHGAENLDLAKCQH